MILVGLILRNLKSGVIEEIDMTEYLHELLVNNKKLIEQGEFEKLYNNTRVGFKYELTQVLLASGIDPFIDDGKIFPHAFNYPEAEVNYTLGPGITEIEESAFEGAELTSFTIPSTVKMIGKRAFWGSSIQEIEFDAGSQELVIGESAFENCGRLENLIVPDRCKIISSKAFRDAWIKTCKLSNNLIELGDFSFFNTDINEIEIPKSIKFIGKAPFHNCYYLKKLRCPESIRGTMNYENLLYGITEEIVEWY